MKGEVKEGKGVPATEKECRQGPGRSGEIWKEMERRGRREGKKKNYNK